MKTTSRILPTLCGVVLGLLIASPVSALTISQAPLFITASVNPNVMLLIDDSGSMKNMVWADGFDSSTPSPYPDWSDDGAYWDKGDMLISHSSLGQGSCAADYIQGKNAGATTKCLKLPDSGDDGTYYTDPYLNYLFETYADGTDLTTGTIPLQTRMQVAREAAKTVIDQSSDIRFGSASFNSNDGATIDANCGATTAVVKTAIDGYSAGGGTPLAESLYEITRYFRGLDSYTSPLQYRCQQNFAIVITDGHATRDTCLPGSGSVFESDGTTAICSAPPAADPADTADTDHALPNWDDEAPETLYSDFPTTPQYSDGFFADALLPADIDDGDAGYTMYLDDLAKFAYDIDFMTSGNDDSGNSWNDADFLKQNMRTYTIGFAIDNQMLEDAAERGDGQYFTADTASQLASQLTAAVENARFKGMASSAAVATNSTRLDTNTIIYQARFNSSEWTGDLKAFGIDVGTGEVNSTPSWSAASNIPAENSRNIVTYESGTTAGIDFEFPADYTAPAAGEMNIAMINALLADAPYASNTVDATEQAANQTYGAELVTYLRGSNSTAGTYNGAFRSRDSVLGDIVNSNPTYVSTRDYGYDTLPSTEGTAYTTYRGTTAYQNRTNMVYVGANDGMLHAFNAGTGVEMFAFVPSTVFPKLNKLADSTYSHEFYVNGSPRAADAYINSTWKTLLVGAPGAGGRGIFVLDVTNPGSFSASNVIGEYTNANDTDVGYVLGQPTIARLGDGNWAAIFGNGYNSANDRAMLFIVNLNDGSLIRKIDTGVGDSTNPNGLGATVPVDLDGDRITDVIYAGDLLGNLWKFDLRNNNVNNWNVAYTQGNTLEPLYEAKDASNNPQPITVRPSIGSHPDGGLMVYFGTGQFFAVGDNIVPGSPLVQSFYGIWDNDASVTGGRTALQQQTITHEAYDVTFGSNQYDIRVVSDTDVDYSNDEGWYLDLLTAGTTAEGERVVFDPVLRNGRIIFSTLIPDRDPCGYGGTSWLMEMDAINGSRFDYPVFDLNGDGKFTEDDYYTDDDGNKYPVSGLRYGEIVAQPVVVDAGEKEHKYMSGSSGNISHVTEKGDYESGRQSWRQLR